MQNVNIFALGGQDENGKNSLLVEIEHDMFLVNAGIMVPVSSNTGIDGVIPEFKYVIERSNRLKGLFVTHAHDEFFAAIPWLIMELKGLKIYASKFAIEVLQNRISKYKIGHDDYELIEIAGELKIGNTTVRSFNVANSIPGSLAFSFSTNTGNILVMSSVVNDDLGAFGATDLEGIKNTLGKIDVLCLDARTANFHGSSADKKSVKPFLVNEFQVAKPQERIIIGAYDEEMYNLNEVMELAMEFNRPVVRYGGAYDFLYTKIQNMPTVARPQFMDHQGANRTNNAVILVTGTWSRLYQRFVRIAENSDVYLRLRPDDHIIMMAPPINGMEVEYSEMLDIVAHSSKNIIDLTENNLYKFRPAEDDIKRIVSVLKPDYFIPISALYRYLVVAAKHAATVGLPRDRSLVLVNGKIAHFIDGKLASQKATVKAIGDVLIDGFGVGDISQEVIRDRKSLATGGLVTIAATIDKHEKTLINEPVIQVIGVVAKTQLKKIQEYIKSALIQKMNEGKENWKIHEVQNNIRKKVQKILFKLIGKEPVLVVTLIEI